MNQLDETVLEALRQSDAAWALVREARWALYATIAGVGANLLLALAAVGIPAWQRRVTRRDQNETQKREWGRFIEAFKAVTEALGAVVAASQLKETVAAFQKSELQLRRAIDALAKTSAVDLPVRAALNAAAVQQEAAATLAMFPNLTLYGSNLMTYDTIKKKLQSAHETALTLLHSTELLESENSK